MRFLSQFRRMHAAQRAMLAATAGVLLLINTTIAIGGEKESLEATFRTLSGETLQLSDYRGKPVLLSFWSTSCVICIREMPNMKLLYHTLKAAGAELISITMPYDPPNHVVEATEQHELPFPVAIDLDGMLMQSFDIPGTPINILVSPEGDIVRTFTGALDYAKTLGAVTALVQK